jgi:hypothetical protein
MSMQSNHPLQELATAAQRRSQPEPLQTRRAWTRSSLSGLKDPSFADFAAVLAGIVGGLCFCAGCVTILIGIYQALTSGSNLDQVLPPLRDNARKANLFFAAALVAGGIQAVGFASILWLAAGIYRQLRDR